MQGLYKLDHDNIYGEFFLMLLFRLEVMFNLQEYQTGHH